MRRPGGAVWPAMNPTTGFFTLAFDVCRGGLFGIAADLADHHDGVGIRVRVEQLAAHPGKLVPMIGSPPIPMHVDWPMPSLVNWPTAS